MPAEKKLTACISPKNTKKFAIRAMTSIEIKAITKMKEHKGSRKNKFTILGVEAPVGQGVKTQEYRDIPSFYIAARRDASAYKM
jgi:hypothetical protein